jgi:plastocyanin
MDALWWRLMEVPMRPTLPLRQLSSSLCLTLCVVAIVGCGSSNSTSGTGGTSAGSGGASAGSGGASAGSGGATGSGGAPAGSGGATGSGGSTGSGGAQAAFTAVNPCKAEGDYTTTGTTVMFGGSSLVYEPKCLKVAAGASVTFTGMNGETFSGHPLTPSTERGTLTENPIKSTMSNTNSKSFTFPTPGFYAYYCLFHGLDSATASDNGMAGVVWVQ